MLYVFKFYFAFIVIYDIHTVYVRHGVKCVKRKISNIKLGRPNIKVTKAHYIKGCVVLKYSSYLSGCVNVFIPLLCL